MPVPLPILIASPLAIAWTITRSKRILPPTTEEILSRIHQGELDRIKDFTPHNPANDVLKTDPRVWECIGGFRGLRRKRENAVCCVQLCQRYVLDSNMDKRDVDYVSQRSFAIAFLTQLSIGEELLRFIWRGMPHLCGRWVAYLYWEAAMQTRMLNLEYGTGRLNL